MTYDKDNDILEMYKWKCGFETQLTNGKIQKCPIKFMDKPSLKLHLLLIHGYRAHDLALPNDPTKRAIRSIQMARKC